MTHPVTVNDTEAKPGRDVDPVANETVRVEHVMIAPVNREMILNYVAQHSLGLPRSY